MTRHRSLLLGGLVLVALAVTLSLPAVRWRMIGWWRGEAFYRGRPTSFYRPLCHLNNLPVGSCVPMKRSDDWPWVRTVLGDRIADWLVGDENPLWDCGPDAVPVLVDLL